MLSSLQASLDTLLPVCVTVCQPGVIHLLSESSSHILTYAHKRTCWTQTDTNTQTDTVCFHLHGTYVMYTECLQPWSLVF